MRYEKLNEKEAKEAIVNLYEKTDQAVYHIVEKFNEYSRGFFEDLEENDKALFHSRYEWLSNYLMHYRLGANCLWANTADDEEDEWRA